MEVLFNKKITLLVGVYAPVNDKESFYKEMKKKIRDTNYEQITLLGDFSGVIDPLKDSLATEIKTR